MSHINVTINGRQYRMACEEGQEVRLLKLAENMEARVESLRGKFGEIGDSRLTVMAALTVCDELLDANARIRALEGELETLRNVRVAAADRDENELASRIQALGADRSRLADELDGSLVKTRRLERTNREIAEKLDAAIGTIRTVLAAGEGS